MATLKGLLYIKHGQVGTKSEGPEYFLQTRKRDFKLIYTERNPWEPDYNLEFYCRKMVEINGELSEGGMPARVLVEKIKEIREPLLPSES
jgi:hypothetical protein